MATEIPQSLSLNQRHPHQSGSLQVTETARSEPGHGAIAVLSCALGEGSYRMPSKMARPATPPARQSRHACSQPKP